MIASDKRIALNRTYASISSWDRHSTSDDIEEIAFRGERVQQAVAWLREADGLLITAGTGMGVDSGLPDFRGNAGLWCAYSAIVEAKGFQSIANPRTSEQEPELAWGFYGHRLRLYREFERHPSFAVLKGWGEHAERGVFVFTSNVGGQFQWRQTLRCRMTSVHAATRARCCAANAVARFRGRVF